ncbi:MAG: hypothetical protein WD766_10160 [Gemmatimonadota bacterium]
MSAETDGKDELQAAWPGTRVRFDSLQVDKSEPGRVGVRVSLDWNRQRHEGEASGESGFVGELRASAMATVRTLGKVVGDDEAFSLVGVKEIHVFDHDIVAVLLNSPRLPERRLIGLAIVGDDRPRAAALAVLNATNRALGTLSGTGGS